VLAALLASGTTAGALVALDDDGTAATAASSSTSSGTRAPSVPLSGRDVDWSTVAAGVEPSVVSIQVSSATGSGEGSGVVLDGDGHVVTNNHVVVGAGAGGRLQVVLNDGRVLDADVVGTDPTTDLAVLKLQDAPDDLTPATFADSSAVKVGDPVMAVGNPLGLSDTVTTGIVSAVDRPVTTQAEGSSPFDRGEPVVTNAIQTDAAVNPGNSGGALVDATGRVIGINSSIATMGAAGAGTSSGSIGLGFAIPSNEVERIAGELLADGSAEHAFLGVSLQDATVETGSGRRQAAGIVEVVAGSAADDAGLRVGDAVTAVNGEPVVGAESLTAQVRERAPGTSVELTVVRDGKTSQVRVLLDTRASS
jgi:putative serine protease PepD